MVNKVVTVVMVVTVVTPQLPEGLHVSFCFIYSVVSENHSVQNSPWGEGVYKQLTVYNI